MWKPSLSLSLSFQVMKTIDSDARRKKSKHDIEDQPRISNLMSKFCLGNVEVSLESKNIRFHY